MLKKFLAVILAVCVGVPWGSLNAIARTQPDTVTSRDHSPADNPVAPEVGRQLAQGYYEGALREVERAFPPVDIRRPDLLPNANRRTTYYPGFGAASRFLAEGVPQGGTPTPSDTPSPNNQPQQPTRTPPAGGPGTAESSEGSSGGFDQNMMMMLFLALGLGGGGGGSNAAAFLPLLLFAPQLSSMISNWISPKVGEPGKKQQSSLDIGSMVSLLVMTFLLSSTLGKKDPPTTKVGRDYITGKQTEFTRPGPTGGGNSSNSAIERIFPYLGLLGGGGGLTTLGGGVGRNEKGGTNPASLLFLLPALMSTQQKVKNLPNKWQRSTEAGMQSNYFMEIVITDGPRKGEHEFRPVGLFKGPAPDQEILYAEDGSGDWLAKTQDGLTWKKDLGQPDSAARLVKVAKGPDNAPLSALSDSDRIRLGFSADTPLMQADGAPQLSAAAISNLNLPDNPLTNLFLFDPATKQLRRIGYHVRADGSWTLYTMTGDEQAMKTGDSVGNVYEIKEGKKVQTIVVNATLELGRILGRSTVPKLVLDPLTGYYRDEHSANAYRAVAGPRGATYEPVKALDGNNRPVEAADSYGRPIVDAQTGNKITVDYVDENGQQFTRNTQNILIPIIYTIADLDNPGAQLRVVLRNLRDSVYFNPSDDRSLQLQFNSGDQNSGSLQPYTGTWKFGPNATAKYEIAPGGQRIIARIDVTFPEGRAVLLRQDNDRYARADSDQIWRVNVPNTGAPQYIEATGTFQRGSLKIELRDERLQRHFDPASGDAVKYAGGTIPIEITYKENTLPVVERLTTNNGTADLSSMYETTVERIHLKQQIYVRELPPDSNRDRDTRVNPLTTMPNYRYTYDVDADAKRITVVDTLTGKSGTGVYDAAGILLRIEGAKDAFAPGAPPRRASFPTNY